MTTRRPCFAALASLLAAGSAWAGDGDVTPLNVALQPGTFLRFDGANTRASVAMQGYLGDAVRLNAAVSVPLDSETRFGFLNDAGTGPFRLSSGAQASIQIGYDFSRAALALTPAEREHATHLPEICRQIGASPCTPEAIRAVEAGYPAEHAAEGSAYNGRQSPEGALAYCLEYDVLPCSPETIDVRHARAERLYNVQETYFRSHGPARERERDGRFLDRHGVAAGAGGARRLFGYAGLRVDGSYSQVEAYGVAGVTGDTSNFDRYSLRFTADFRLDIGGGDSLFARGGVTFGQAPSVRSVDLCQQVASPTMTTAQACRAVTQLRGAPEMAVGFHGQLAWIHLFRRQIDEAVPGFELSATVLGAGQPGSTLTVAPGVFLTPNTGSVVARFGVALDGVLVLGDDFDASLRSGNMYLRPRLVIGASY